MQVTEQKMIDKRSTFYMARLVEDELKKGEDYEKVKNTIVINLLNFEFYQRNSYHNIAHMKFEETKEEERIDMGYQKEQELATEDLEMHFIEIPKFVKKNPDAKSKLEQWLWLLAGREEKLEMAKKENKEIKKAMEIIDEMSMDETEWELYRSRQMAIMDYNAGMRKSKEEGLEEGEKKSKLEIAKELIKMGMKIEDIERVTKLTKLANKSQ